MIPLLREANCKFRRVCRSWSSIKLLPSRLKTLPTLTKLFRPAADAHPKQLPTSTRRNLIAAQSLVLSCRAKPGHSSDLPIREKRLITKRARTFAADGFLTTLGLSLVHTSVVAITTSGVGVVAIRVNCAISKRLGNGNTLITPKCRVICQGYYMGPFFVMMVEDRHSPTIIAPSGEWHPNHGHDANTGR